MKEATLSLRMKSEHLDMIKAAAEHDGVTVTAWVTSRLLNAARREGAVDYLDIVKTLPRPSTATKPQLAPVRVIKEGHATPNKPKPAMANIKLTAEQTGAIFNILGRTCLDCADTEDVSLVEVVTCSAPSPYPFQPLCPSCAPAITERGLDLRDERDIFKLRKIDLESNNT